jgi:PTK7 protein tyrosine kinase 7
VKIGSFGMDKKPFNNDYYVYKHQSIALRWLPHEAVLEDEYSTKSDVWMFAVTIWELHNAAQQPLSTRSDEVLMADLRKKSSQLWDASFCKSNAMSSLLVKCWSHDPLLRPSFDELLQCAESTSALTPSSNGESTPR